MTKVVTGGSELLGQDDHSLRESARVARNNGHNDIILTGLNRTTSRSFEICGTPKPKFIT